MTDNNCSYQNPLVRDGVSQDQRMPEALDPEYVKVDGRSLADLLRFVNKYAELLQYYNTDNTPDGDWQPFFEKDMTSIIVMLTDEHPPKFINCLEELEGVIYDDSSTLNEVRNAVKTLFDIVATLAIEFNHWYRESAQGYKFHAHIERVISSDLRPALQKMIAYYKGAFVGTDMINKNFVAPKNRFDINFVSFEALKNPEQAKHNLEAVWIDNTVNKDKIEDWAKYFELVDSNTSIYETDSTAVQVRAKEGFTVLREIVRCFVSAIKTTQQQVPQFVEETLESFSGHDPHMGLLLTFFQLFRHAQEQMNTLTGRHLDFYYEEVLHLARKDAVPDQVYLIGELAKHVGNYKIDEGTLFKAGKDAQGNKVLYRANDDVVLNKAKVEQFKSIYIDEDDGYRIYEKPVANSRDGLGAELENSTEGWKPFGESQLIKGDESTQYVDPSSMTMQFSSVGFAIASPVLMMEGGSSRAITVTIELEADPGELPVDADLLECYATGPEDWIKLKVDTFDKSESTFVIGLSVMDETPIGAYNSEVHGLGYQTSMPLLKIVLANDRTTESYVYGYLREQKIETIEVEASVTGLKDLIIQNELGPLDPGKSFQPFGPEPSKGTAFYIGSHEAFSKELEDFTVRIKWHDYPSHNLESYYNYDGEGDMVSTKSFESSISNEEFSIDIEVLSNGAWNRIVDNEMLFPSEFENTIGDTKEHDLGPYSFSKGWKPKANPFSEYNVNVNRGFIRFLLDGPSIMFGHKVYSRLLMKQLQEESEIPVEPYTPKIKSIELDYTASVTMNSSESNSGTNFDQLYHCHPFGTQLVFGGSESQDDVLLLPTFVHGVDTEIDHTGEFLIGLSGLQPPQQLSLLFKMVEGSGDPTLDSPPVHWFYLSEEGWQLFESADIAKDTTNGLLDSGIIRLNMPQVATDDSTLLPGNLHWIKAAVNDNAGAVSRIVNVHAQALTAEFKDEDNDPNFLNEVLSAQTIGKLKDNKSEVKKIKQPYASEGGKVAEQDEEYYRRVNERLRHKDRGINVWDYERLVLQQFPSIYKVKCINHSVYGLEKNGREMNAEFAPGYVTLIVVPDLSNKQAFNPLKPRVSLNVLGKVERFLKRKISVFAAENMEVSNPLFEQIKAELFVEFNPGEDEGFHRNKLVKDITAFLSPWAYKEGKEISFGGSIHKSVILNFIEERPYVDFVTDFKIHHYLSNKQKQKDVSEIAASEARSVLASNHTHIINSQSISVSDR